LSTCELDFKEEFPAMGGFNRRQNEDQARVISFCFVE